MKETGIVRKVDELGRVVIPIEIRNKFGINEKDPIEIYVEGKAIVLKKQEKTCIFCNSQKKLIEFNENLVCKNCLDKLKSL